MSLCFLRRPLRGLPLWGEADASLAHHAFAIKKNRAETSLTTAPVVSAVTSVKASRHPASSPALPRSACVRLCPAPLPRVLATLFR
eukprot:352115-Chlamydomonas_euryale.AAC.7